MYYSVLAKLSVHCPSYYCLNLDGLTLVINQSFSVCFHERVARFPRFIHSFIIHSPGGGGNSHIKVTGMLVISLKGVNCRFRFHLGCLGRKVTIFAHSGIS